MMVALKDGRRVILSIQPGEELLEEIKKYCHEAAIHAATIVSVIGAVERVELAWYDLVAKEYKTRLFDEHLEIASAMGSVSKYDDDLIIHLHGVFSDREFKTMAGHVKSAIISAAGEVSLIQLNGMLNRSMNDEIGLPLLK